MTTELQDSRSIAMAQQPSSSSLDISADGSDRRRTFVTRGLTKVYGVGEDVLAAPVSALFRHGGAWAVFVHADGRARLREVVVGHRNSWGAEVLEGLVEGEQVVLYPSDRISDGVAVTMRPPG